MKSTLHPIMLRVSRVKTSSWPALALCLVLLLTLAQAASAHATLVKSDPQDHATMTDPPQQVHMWFSEDVNHQLSAVHVLDANGSEIQADMLAPDPQDPNRMSVNLPWLEPGLYTVAYTALSHLDGHKNEGSISFGVGLAGGAAAEMRLPGEQVASDPLDNLAMFAGVFFRWLNYITLAFLVGVFAIALWVLTPSILTRGANPEVRRLQHQARQGVLGWGILVAGVAFLAGLGYLVWQVSDLMSIAQPEISFDVLAGRLLLQTPAGALWLIRQGLVSLLLVLLSLAYRLDVTETPGAFENPRAKRAQRWIAVGAVLAAGIMLTQALASHAAALPDNTGLAPAAGVRSLAVALDALHLIAVGCWLGGLVSLRIGLSPLIASEDENFVRLTRATWSPFSFIAGASVATLVATGLFATGAQVASLDALLSTPYGLTLAAKLGVFLLVGLFGLVNAMMLHPSAAVFRPVFRLLRRPAGWTPLPVRRMPVVTIAEACAGAIVLFIVGYLVANPTANSPQYRYAGYQQANPLIQSDAGITGVLSVTPNLPGINTLQVGVSDATGQLPAGLSRVIVHTRYQGQAIGTESADAAQAQPGIYELKGDQFSLVGLWSIDVVIRRGGFQDTTLHYDWVVPPAGQTRLVSNQDWQPVLAGLGGLILAVILFAGGWLFWKRWRIKSR